MLVVTTFLIKALLITKVCKSLTIYQPSYVNHRGYVIPKIFRENNKTALEREKSKSISMDLNGTSIGSTPAKYFDKDIGKDNKSTKVMAYKAGIIANILNPYNTNSYDPPINPIQYGLGNSVHVSPIQYQYINPIQTAATISSDQPVTTAHSESKILYAPLNSLKNPWKGIQILSVNYNNKIYHINKRASPSTNNYQKYPPIIVRKQRNFRVNHDNNYKLIEQNAKETQDIINDEPGNLSTIEFSVKQPSSSKPKITMTSHEIQYLHDIFQNYPKPHHFNFGHVELSPVLFEKRFESLKAGNRYKGEVTWLDNTGGYAQHYWDLAQGAV